MATWAVDSGGRGEVGHAAQLFEGLWVGSRLVHGTEEFDLVDLKDPHCIQGRSSLTICGVSSGPKC